MAWVRGNKYDKAIDEDRILLSTLEHVYSRGSYNVYKMIGDHKYLIVFSNQKDLLQLIQGNDGSVFAIKLLKPEHAWYSYPVKIIVNDNEEVSIPGYTLGAGMVCLRGDFEDRRIITTNSDGTIVML